MSDTVEVAIARKHPLAKCEECPLYDESYVPPNYNGLTQPKYLFVGEAPGGKEVRQGKPFVGMSGRLLDLILEETDIDKKQSALTNAVMCRPQGNDTPSDTAISCCKPALQGVIEELQPEYVVSLGATAAKSLLDDNKVKITKERVGPPRDMDGYKYVPTVHPAACLRNPNLFPLLVGDIKKLIPNAYITWEPPKYKAVDDAQDARAVISELRERRNFSTLVLDLEVGEDKDDSFGHPNTLLAAGMGYEPGKVVVIGTEAFRDANVRQDFSKLLESKEVVCHNGKYDLGVLYRMGFGLFDLAEDTMLKSYTLNEMKGVHGLKYLAKERLGLPDWDKELWEWNDGKEGKWDDIPKDVLYKYNAFDVAATWDLNGMLTEDMDQHDKQLHEFLCWTSIPLMLIESDGVLLDEPNLVQMDKDMEKELVQIKNEISQIASIKYGDLDANTVRLMSKGGFNPNSPDQVRGMLSCLTGATVATTDIEMLKIINSKYKGLTNEFTELMIQWRSVAKMHGTYVKGWMNRMDEDSRVHPTYLIHGTETGRLSARNPNVQNPPREGFRKTIIAGEGNSLIYADFGNIEGRVVSVLAESESMQAILRDPDRDIHSEVAKMIYGPNFDKEQRVVAKTVVHGKNYARTAEGIAEGLGISIGEASKVSRAYDKLVPEVTDWHKDMKRRILQTDDPLITPWGRKRRFGLITRDNAEDVFKEGLAFQPQSIGSDICLTAACRLREQGVPVRIVIHDGILVEVPTDTVPDVAKHMEEVMVQAGREYTDKVPFPVDIGVGQNWQECE